VSQHEVPLDPASALERGLSRLERAGEVLRALPDAQVIAALAQAARTLRDPATPLGKQARASLPGRTELSAAMIDWALETTLETADEAALAAALDAHRRSIAGAAHVPARLHAVVLSSNLFTACVKPIVWSLLLRAPVALKVSLRDEGFAELFALAVLLADEAVGEAILCARFGRDDEDLTRRLVSGADAVSIYGGDATVRAVRALAPADAEVIPHGHGLGAIYVGRDSLGADADLGPLLAGMALDVAAYDQRGCLSPQLVLVERGGAVSPRELARRLSEEGLRSLSTSLPRGPLPVEASTTQVRWRRASEALGELFEGDGYAVAYDDEGPLRPCPGARNIAVHAARDAAHAAARLAPLGVHLKCLATTGALPLPPPLAPRRCVPGRMQRPTVLDLHDGRRPWHGLGRQG